MKTETEIEEIQDDTQTEDNVQELNAWQAVGIYAQFAIDETIAKRMQANEQLAYISLVRASFGLSRSAMHNADITIDGDDRVVKANSYEDAS